MYIYELTAFEYSDFERWLISHKKKFSKDEFKAMVNEAVNEIEESPYNWFSMIKLIDNLVEKFGFKRYSPEATVYVGGFEGYNVDYERGERDE